MLSWLAMFVGGSLGMKNRIEQYQKVKKPRFNEALDKKLAQDLARADDDGFVITDNHFRAQSAEQDSDCWNDLWQLIKAKSFRFFNRKKGPKIP